MINYFKHSMSKLLFFILIAFIFLFFCIPDADADADAFAWSGAKKYRDSINAAVSSVNQRIVDIRMQSIEIIEPPASNIFDAYGFSFVGPTMDADLTRFYAYFVKSYPEALIPIKARVDIAQANCKDRAIACGTLSQVVFYYGLLGRNFPSFFEDQVLNPLEKKYGRGVIPGLKLKRWEGRLNVFYEGKDPSSLCEIYRLDGRDDCIMRKNGENSYTVRTQGLKTHIVLPKNRARNLIFGYRKFIKDSSGWKQERIGIHAHSGLNDGHEEEHSEYSQSIIDARKASPSDPIPARTEKASPMDLVTARTGTIKACSENTDDPPENLNTREKIRNHISLYRDASIGPMIKPLKEMGRNLSYPMILIIDDFGSSISGGEIKLKDIKHPLLHEDTEISCLETSPNYNIGGGGHGVFALGLLFGKNSSVGNIALLPDFPQENVVLLQVGNILKKGHLSVASDEVYESSGDRTVIVNLSISRGLEKIEKDGSTTKRDLWKHIKNTPEVLYIVSAGNAKTGPKGKDLNGFCDIEPACFGDMGNVITVAALSEIESKESQVLWRGSNHGGEVVTIAAPGVNIISTDFDNNNNPTLSKRDGTSHAAVFVTAVAARLLSLKPNLKPFQVKNIIMASARPIGERPRDHPTAEPVFHLFGGKNQGVSAGAIDGAMVKKVAKGGFIKLAGVSDDTYVESFEPKSGVKRIYFHKDSYATRKDMQGCIARKIYRIYKSESNRYSVLCERPPYKGDPEEPQIKLLFVNDHYLEIEEGSRVPHMKCLKEEDGCFFLEDIAGVRRYVKIQEIENGVFLH